LNTSSDASDRKLTARLAFLVVCSITICAIGSTSLASSARVELNPDLQVEELSQNIWRHISWEEVPGFGRSPANGLIVVSGENAALIDTPWNNELTAQLVNWVESTLCAKVEMAVTTHSHHDCAGGLTEIHHRGGSSIALGRTAEIARENGDPVPTRTFSDATTIHVGATEIELRYLGRGHTEDNIVAWLPEQRVLFGGCLVKSAGSRHLGYTEEAAMAEWPLTIESVQKTFPLARIIVPGHGSPGGTELLDRTLELLRANVDTDASFVFYLHGKIVEDQGRNAVSARFGPYLYDDIVASITENGFEVISEVRPKSTDGHRYAQKIVQQIGFLRSAGVSARHISVIGASKGAGITVLISNQIQDPEISYVLLAICSDEIVESWRGSGICPTGRVLSIYDSSDDFAGTCANLAAACSSSLSQFDEVRLDIGSGHGLLYRPFEQWIVPTVSWISPADPVEQ
jgi:metallo-beta-lactamase class B